jgi:hypothetical protein
MPTIGIDKEKAKPLAVANPILNPVKEPGPIDTAIPSILFSFISVKFRIQFKVGKIIAE